MYTIPPHSYTLVQPTGIEPVSMPLQDTAMTTSAKVALVPRVGVEPTFKFLFLRETTLPICLPGQKKKLHRKYYVSEDEAMFGENDGNRTHAKRITISDATITSQTPLFYRSGIDFFKSFLAHHKCSGIILFVYYEIVYSVNDSNVTDIVAYYSLTVPFVFKCHCFHNYLLCLAGPERFELPTSSFEDLHSIQLS